MSRRQKNEIEHPEGSLSFSTEMICKSELEAAIHAIAFQYNIIAVHLLASDAHEVMRGYAKALGKYLRADVLSSLEKAAGDRSIEMARVLRTPYNSLKHSNNPGESAVTVHPQYVEVTLSQACQEFGAIFGYLTPKMLMYTAWVMIAYPAFRNLIDEENEAFDLFASALTDGPRYQMLSSLRERITYIDDHPDEFSLYKDTLSTTSIWDDDPSAAL